MEQRGVFFLSLKKLVVLYQLKKSGVGAALAARELCT